jgi:hypothetical protein
LLLVISVLIAAFEHSSIHAPPSNNRWKVKSCLAWFTPNVYSFHVSFTIVSVRSVGNRIADLPHRRSCVIPLPHALATCKLVPGAAVRLYNQSHTAI